MMAVTYSSFPASFRQMLVVAIAVVLLPTVSVAFVTPQPFAINPCSRSASFRTIRYMGFGLGDGDEPPKKLTRESEPEDYFATNMDKMSDSEKIPVALLGLVFISLPFVAGLIALYAAK